MKTKTVLPLKTEFCRRQDRGRVVVDGSTGSFFRLSVAIERGCNGLDHPRWISGPSESKFTI